MTIESPWLTVSEGAEYARCSTETLRRALVAGELDGGASQSSKGGRWVIHRDALDAWRMGTPISIPVPQVTRARK